MSRIERDDEQGRGLDPAAVRAHAAIVAAAVIFGSTFLVMKDAVALAQPVPFVAARFLVGALVLIPFARREPAAPGVWRAGGLCGAALGVGYVFQVIGLQYVTSSVSAFVTYMLVVLVPIISAVVLRRRPESIVLVAVGIALVGLILLTGQGAGLGKGELLTVGCAVSFAVHIVALSAAAPRFPTMRLNAVQLATVGGLCLVPGFFLGGYDFGAKAWGAAVFCGIVASALALGLQLWGQRVVGPTRTALILLIEPVSAAGLGYLAGDRLGWTGAAGAALILVAIVLAELPLAYRRGNLRSSPVSAQP